MSSPVLSFSFLHRSIEHPIAWDPCTNLLAATCRDQHVVSVILLDPQSPENYAVLPVHDAQPTLSLVSLEWSPPGTARTLLALTSLHRIVAWTRPLPQKSSTDPITLNCWQPIPIITAPPDTVHAQWLVLPPLLQWTSPGSHGADKGVLQRFLPLGGGPAASTLSWLRTGMHCIVTTTAQGVLQVHTRQFDLAAGGPTWISGPAISLALEAPVQCANVAWQDADCLAVVLALDNGSNGEVALLSVQGDPTAGTPAVHAISSMPMGDKQKLQGVCFHPTSRGGTFAVVMADGADTEYLQVATYTSVDPHTGAAVDLQSAGSVHLSTRTATDWRGAYVGDGSCLVVAVQGEQGWAVNVLHPHSVGVQHAVPVGGAVAAMAASPNGTLLAVAMQGTLHLHPLGGPPDTPLALPELAHRLLWSMARETPVWDVVAAAQPALDTHERLVQLCGTVDDAVHMTAHALRPHFGLQWNRIKAALLDRCFRGDPALRVPRLDLAVRSLLEYLELVSGLAVSQDTQDTLRNVDKASADAQPGSTEPDRQLGQHAMAWLPTVLTIVRGMLTAVKSWVEAHAAAGAAEDAALDAWPLLRLLPDAYMWKQLTTVVQFWLLPLSKLLPPEGVAMAQELHALHALNKKVHNCIRLDTEAQGISSKALATDDPNVAQRVAQQTIASFKGSVLPLHYHRTMGPVRWTALQQEIANFTDVPSCSAHDLCTQLERLDLLNPSQSSTAQVLRDLLGAPAHLPPELPAPEGLPPGLAVAAAPADLRQWAAERASAFGLVPESMQWDGRTDVLSGRVVDSAAGPLCTAGGCLVTSSSSGAQGAEALVRTAFADVAPLTGSMWKLLK